ncbi:DUF4230 domain-containing protein [Sphingomonas sp. NSE70-1]|uniref:DUF4230 domain-containing protein n=1 Tax=Sphingomonas caseinilyticus TaxID=2908205 RepID=A0ABT0RWA3_9SPHN|nr:DUF4230 domain-containing protein [Sphingomonas caseinilyticus]MCL6699091.1 DUF4230 domain-containing protein [Sphingomonas caseinilyticus]
MQHWKLLVVTHLAAGLFGFSIAPRELLETEVKSAGFFTTDTRRVLAVTVESLRAENKLLVYTYKGSAAVSVERAKLWFLTGRQDLIIPAQVGYFVDLSRLTVEDVIYDERRQLLTVMLPPLVLGDVAFQPEAARTINGGLLTFDQDQVDELARANYLTARRAFIKQAQGATIVQAAKENAIRSIRSNVEIPLEALGYVEINVLVRVK